MRKELGQDYLPQCCPCCLGKSNFFLQVSDYSYFQCKECGTIFIDNNILQRIDQGLSLVEYSERYWTEELQSARDRAFGCCLARMAETIYYCKRPIKKFLDIGTGPGYFLDAISLYLPNIADDIFYGVEKFPPDISKRTCSKNYIIGDIDSIDFKVDSGLCMEVIEHLTPNMLKDLFNNLARISNEDAMYIFNTGMPEYVEHEDMNYLDPIKRGHIVSYSLKAVELLSKDHGFLVHKINGKTWAFALEYSRKTKEINIHDRIWQALDCNLSLLTDNKMGSVLRILGLETSRAYGY